MIKLSKRQKAYLPFKRFLDIVFSLVSIIVLIPFFIVFSIVVMIAMHDHSFFRQERAGKNKKTFLIYKYRTMVDKSVVDPVTNEQKVIHTPTKFGLFMRKTSLDELPQLMNILLGKMSFVGPRPLIWDEINVINERDKYGVYQLKPGLTGHAQVNGRNLLTCEEKAKFDAEYLKKMSLWFDISIIFKTMALPFRKKH